MEFTRNELIDESVTRDAVLKCYGVYKCTAVSSCQSGNDTAALNSENYEAVKEKYTPPSPSPHS